jgi:hypothetical protein
VDDVDLAESSPLAKAIFMPSGDHIGVPTGKRVLAKLPFEVLG